jgi:predicted dehydrogenase
MYRVGVIGCRGIGNRHAQGAESLENAEVVAGCDLVPEQRDEFAAQFKATNPELKMYADYQEMLEKAQLDIVTVATGDNRHADLVVAAAEAGAKGIFCEKPLATSVEDADRMVAAAERHNALLSVDHTRHWFPVWHRCRELVTTGEIGDVRAVVCEHYGTRSMLFRNGTHLLDAIMWFAGGRPQWVVAELEDGYEDYGEYRGDGGHDPATEPSANALIRFDNGVRAVYHGDKQAQQRTEFTVSGTEGRLLIAGENAFLDRGERREPVAAPQWEVKEIQAGVHELVRVLDGEGELSCTGRDGLAVVEMMLACLQSQVRGNVRIPIPLERS